MSSVFPLFIHPSQLSVHSSLLHRLSLRFSAILYRFKRNTPTRTTLHWYTWRQHHHSIESIGPHSFKFTGLFHVDKSSAFLQILIFYLESFQGGPRSGIFFRNQTFDWNFTIWPYNSELYNKRILVLEEKLVEHYTVYTYITHTIYTHKRGLGYKIESLSDWGMKILKWANFQFPSLSSWIVQIFGTFSLLPTYYYEQKVSIKQEDQKQNESDWAKLLWL